ncbi:Ger(x)C family spore germination protein [Paenibacillus sp. CF384]|uniref:Ger(x)C family spore germination protein n=1 Tax=Paenibacillus sp. CF384 TaxID=1884382 RepID=UPI0008989625|nr:Ger(x)C family spore germination protein [Paenibacillus sp. CF384]SDX70623.1 germination protein, Ger(x)C family [Paenibacillus sp. CF384]
MSRFIVLLWIPVIVLVLVLAGCANAVVVDHIRSLTVLGFDKHNSGYKASALYADYADKGRIKVLRGDSNRTRTMIKEMAFQSAQPIRIEKLKMLAFSKEVAAEGVKTFIKTFCRDPIISFYAILAVVDDSVASLSESLLGKDSQEFPYHLLEQNMKQEMIPHSTVATVLFDYYGLGRDISVPYLKLNANKEIEIAGYGIFKDDRLKLVLNHEEMVHYKLLQGRALRGEIPFVIRKDSKQSPAVFNTTSGKMKRKISTSDNKTTFTYSFVLEGMVTEYPDWFSLGEEDNTKSLADQLEKQLQTHLLDLLHKFVKEGVDPLGIGDLTRSRQRGWTEAKFYAAEYDHIQFDVHIHIRLTKAGIAE